MHVEDWAWLLDSYVGFEFERDSRWHPRHEGGVRSPDRIGDHLIHRLWSEADYLESSGAGQAGVIEDYLLRGVEFACPLLEYDRETRALVKLAHTGHAIELIERFHRWIDAALRRAAVGRACVWQSQLCQEREDRLQSYEALLESDDVFRAQVRLELQTTGGDEHEYYLEVLTLLKHDYQIHSQRLFPAERALMLAVCDRLAKLSGAIIMTIPTWFASSLELGGRELNHRWRGAEVSVQYLPANGESEEAFVTQLALWMPLNHPHIARLFAACHVGKRFHIHEPASSSDHELVTYRDVFNWGAVYQCILGLEHLHLCGAAYREFTQDCIMRASGKAVLYVRGITQRDGDDEDRSLATNLRCLAQIIFASIKNARRSGPDETDLQSVIDLDRPCFLSAPERSVLAAMHSFDTDDQVAILRILQQLQALINASCGSFEFEFAPLHPTNSVFRTNTSSGLLPAEPNRRLSSVSVLLIGRSFGDVFDEFAKLFCGCEDDTEDLDHHVYRRLLNLYEQFRDRYCSSLPSELLALFSSITMRFYRSTATRREFSCSSALSISCAARTIASRNYSYHYEIDRLLAFPSVISTSPVHDWTGRWKRNRGSTFGREIAGLSGPRGNGINTLSGIIETLEAREESEEGVEWDREQEEAAVVLQFEATRRRGAYSPTELRALQSAQLRVTSGSGSISVPKWFIPSYEVELGEFVAEGAFGAVYRGKWFGADVAIKMLLGVNSAEQRRAFVREAEIWFMLNHPNVVKLYGACHVGPRPFFVCEWAANGTLPEKMNEIAARAPTIYNAWRYLHEAAVGLQFLHDQGIVHGDLKGNNILIGTDHKTKLTDFGLSRFQRLDNDESEAENTGALGAYRWKAPEVLNGDRPTFASDVYAFAMCMIEAVTCEYPWGNELLDSVVKAHVKRGRQPETPPDWSWGLVKDERELIRRMSSFNPSERPSIASVVEALED